MEKIDISQVEMNPFTSIGQDDFLLSAGDESSWNTMTAGCGGMGYMWGKPCCFVFVRESRYTLSFMDKFDSFSVSFFPPEKKSILSFCGSHAGNYLPRMRGIILWSGSGRTCIQQQRRLPDLRWDRGGPKCE